MITTSESTAQRAAPPVPPLARVPVGAVAVVVALYHLVVGSLERGHFFDEALMLAIGRHHLDWGSADQPPVAPLLAGLLDAIAPGVNPVLHAVPALLTAAAVVVAALIAREMGGDARAQTMTALAQATGLWTVFVGHWVTPYSLEPIQWLLIVWLLVRWIRVRDDRLLLVVGVVLGIATQTKFQVVGLGVALVVALLAVGPRELLRRPAFWVAALLGALIAAPTLVWQAVHGWPQVQMGAIAASEASLFGGPGPNAAAMLLLAGLLGVVLIVAGFVGAVRDPRLRPYRFLAVAFVLLWIVFAVLVGRAYYLVGMHGAAAALGAVWLQHRREAGHRRLRWTVWPGAILSVLLAGLVHTGSSGFTSSAEQIQDKVATTVAQVYRALPPGQQAHTVIYGSSYIWSAFVDGADPGLGLPQAHGGNRSYGYFDPPPDDHDTVIQVGGGPTLLAPLGITMRPAADLGDGNTVWVGTGTTRPWSQVWPQLRTLEVQ
ncbi:glycosyltransferase family 39 protein [Pseudonocardia phyllosphaerae]|uniref:glycosyltransferase family 39 protein n=1 Tax=Pseudonocardia phyllosphaerae TaxID=3390502 RepID=UPI00397DCAA6